MTRRNTLVFIIILALFAFAICALIYPVFGREQIRLGLDLVGGSHLVYQAQFPDGATGEDKARAMDRALDTIRTRIDKYGVTEPIIQEQEGERILVQLPGFTDIEAAKSLVEQTGFLEFREVELNNGNPVYLGDYLKNANPEFFNKGEAGTRIFVDENGNPIASLDRDEEGNLKYIDEEGNPIDIEELRQIEEQIKAQLEPGSTALLSWITARGDNGTQLTGGFLREARPSITTGITPEPEVAIEWNEEGGIIFDDIAERLHSRPSDSLERCIGIFLDNILISHPQILEPAYHLSLIHISEPTRPY